MAYFHKSLVGLEPRSVFDDDKVRERVDEKQRSFRLLVKAMPVAAWRVLGRQDLAAEKEKLLKEVRQPEITPVNEVEDKHDMPLTPDVDDMVWPTYWHRLGPYEMRKKRVVPILKLEGSYRTVRRCYFGKGGQCQVPHVPTRTLTSGVAPYKGNVLAPLPGMAGPMPFQTGLAINTRECLDPFLTDDQKAIRAEIMVRERSKQKPLSGELQGLYEEHQYKSSCYDERLSESRMRKSLAVPLPNYVELLAKQKELNVRLEEVEHVISANPMSQTEVNNLMNSNLTLGDVALAHGSAVNAVAQYNAALADAIRWPTRSVRSDLEFCDFIRQVDSHGLIPTMNNYIRENRVAPLHNFFNTVNMFEQTYLEFGGGQMLSIADPSRSLRSMSPVDSHEAMMLALEHDREVAVCPSDPPDVMPLYRLQRPRHEQFDTDESLLMGLPNLRAVVGHEGNKEIYGQPMKATTQAKLMERVSASHVDPLMTACWEKPDGSLWDPTDPASFDFDPAPSSDEELDEAVKGLYRCVHVWSHPEPDKIFPFSADFAKEIMIAMVAFARVVCGMDTPVLPACPVPFYALDPSGDERNEVHVAAAVEDIFRNTMLANYIVVNDRPESYEGRIIVNGLHAFLKGELLAIAYEADTTPDKLADFFAEFVVRNLIFIMPHMKKAENSPEEKKRILPLPCAEDYTVRQSSEVPGLEEELPPALMSFVAWKEFNLRRPGRRRDLIGRQLARYDRTVEKSARAKQFCSDEEGEEMRTASGERQPPVLTDSSLSELASEMMASQATAPVVVSLSVKRTALKVKETVQRMRLLPDDKAYDIEKLTIEGLEEPAAQPVAAEQLMDTSEAVVAEQDAGGGPSTPRVIEKTPYQQWLEKMRECLRSQEPTPEVTVSVDGDHAAQDSTVQEELELSNEPVYLVPLQLSFQDACKRWEENPIWCPLRFPLSGTVDMKRCQALIELFTANSFGISDENSFTVVSPVLSVATDGTLDPKALAARYRELLKKGERSPLGISEVELKTWSELVQDGAGKSLKNQDYKLSFEVKGLQSTLWQKARTVAESIRKIATKEELNGAVVTYGQVFDRQTKTRSYLRMADRAVSQLLDYDKEKKLFDQLTFSWRGSLMALMKEHATETATVRATTVMHMHVIVCHHVANLMLMVPHDITDVRLPTKVLGSQGVDELYGTNFYSLLPGSQEAVRIAQLMPAACAATVYLLGDTKMCGSVRMMQGALLCLLHDITVIADLSTHVEKPEAHDFRDKFLSTVLAEALSLFMSEEAFPPNKEPSVSHCLMSLSHLMEVVYRAGLALQGLREPPQAETLDSVLETVLTWMQTAVPNMTATAIAGFTRLQRDQYKPLWKLMENRGEPDRVHEFARYRDSDEEALATTLVTCYGTVERSCLMKLYEAADVLLRKHSSGVMISAMDGLAEELRLLLAKAGTNLPALAALPGYIVKRLLGNAQGWPKRKEEYELINSQAYASRQLNLSETVEWDAQLLAMYVLRYFTATNICDVKLAFPVWPPEVFIDIGQPAFRRMLIWLTQEEQERMRPMQTLEDFVSHYGSYKQRYPQEARNLEDLAKAAHQKSVLSKVKIPRVGMKRSHEGTTVARQLEDGGWDDTAQQDVESPVPRPVSTPSAPASSYKSGQRPMRVQSPVQQEQQVRGPRIYDIARAQAPKTGYNEWPESRQQSEHGRGTVVIGKAVERKRQKYEKWKARQLSRGAQTQARGMRGGRGGAAERGQSSNWDNSPEHSGSRASQNGSRYSESAPSTSRGGYGSGRGRGQPQQPGGAAQNRGGRGGRGGMIQSREFVNRTFPEKQKHHGSAWVKGGGRGRGGGN